MKTDNISRRQLLAGLAASAWALASRLAPRVLAGRGGSSAAQTASQRPAGVTPEPPPYTVALGQCGAYGPARVEAKLREMVGLCGGLGGIIHAGDTVVIKPNLTGAGRQDGPNGTAPILSYTTHPDVVRAIGKLAREAGASRIILVEARSSETWVNNEYTSAIAELSAEVLEVNLPAPAADYTELQVPSPLALDTIWMNDVIARADVLISVGKLKCHANAGYTGAIKNMVGCLPTPRYAASPGDTSRTGIHTGDWSTRLPKIVVDILQARPVDFAVIDGIATMDQGEGPWNSAQPGITLRCLQPEVLIAGANPVAVDAVGAAVMGFDPEAPHFTTPFLCGLNHLALAAQAGLGSNRLADIDVVGETVAEMITQFTPCPATGSSTPTPSPEPSATPTETPEAQHTMHLPIVKK